MSWIDSWTIAQKNKQEEAADPKGEVVGGGRLYLYNRDLILSFFTFYTIFNGYTPLTVITKYWLYSLYCTTLVCASHSPSPILPFTPLVTIVCSL